MHTQNTYMVKYKHLPVQFKYYSVTQIMKFSDLVKDRQPVIFKSLSSIRSITFDPAMVFNNSAVYLQFLYNKQLCNNVY